MKRNRVDTINEEVKILGLSEIKPPKYIQLRAKDTPFWAAIIESRALTTWNSIDLIHASNLARALADIETLANDIEVEGDTVSTATGSIKAHPKHQLIETLIMRSIRLSRLLHLHASATARAADTRRRTKKEKELLDSQPDEDLLAKPVIQ